MIRAFDEENGCAHTPIWVAHDCPSKAAVQKHGVFLILLCLASLSRNMEALMSRGCQLSKEKTSSCTRHFVIVIFFFFFSQVRV